MAGPASRPRVAATEGMADGVSIPALEAFFAEALPLFALFGMRLTDLAPGRAEIRLRPDSRLIRPGGGLTGPAMFAMADVGFYAAIFTLRGIEPMAVTSDLGMHFVRAARTPEVVCNAEVLKSGRRLAYADARLHDAEGRLVAHASGSYALTDRAAPGSPGAAPS